MAAAWGPTFISGFTEISRCEWAVATTAAPYSVLSALATPMLEIRRATA